VFWYWLIALSAHRSHLLQSLEQYLNKVAGSMVDGVVSHEALGHIPMGHAGAKLALWSMCPCEEVRLLVEGKSWKWLCRPCINDDAKNLNQGSVGSINYKLFSLKNVPHSALKMKMLSKELVAEITWLRIHQTTNT
jgi:hypothetical protein